MIDLIELDPTAIADHEAYVAELINEEPHNADT